MGTRRHLGRPSRPTSLQPQDRVLLRRDLFWVSRTAWTVTQDDLLPVYHVSPTLDRRNPSGQGRWTTRDGWRIFLHRGSTLTSEGFPTKLPSSLQPRDGGPPPRVGAPRPDTYAPAGRPRPAHAVGRCGRPGPRCPVDTTRGPSPRRRVGHTGPPSTPHASPPSRPAVQTRRRTGTRLST